MSKPFKNKVAINFEVEVDSLSDKAQVKQAYTKLAQQIIDYSDAVQRDKNVILVDSVFITKPEDYVTRANPAADAELATIMANRNEVPRNAKPSKAAEEPDLDERPSVKAVDPATYKATKSDLPVPSDTVVKPVKPADQIIDAIFKKLKGTDKSRKILKVFADRAGEEVTVAEILQATKMNSSDISSWLGQTGKKIKALVNTSRGKYKLDPDKIK